MFHTHLTQSLEAILSAFLKYLYFDCNLSHDVSLEFFTCHFMQELRIFWDFEAFGISSFQIQDAHHILGKSSAEWDIYDTGSSIKDREAPGTLIKWDFKLLILNIKINADTSNIFGEENINILVKGSMEILRIFLLPQSQVCPTGPKDWERCLKSEKNWGALAGRDVTSAF